MGYFDDWFEGEMTLELEEMSDADAMVDPWDGDTMIDSPFEDDYIDNLDEFHFRTDYHMRQYWDE